MTAGESTCGIKELVRRQLVQLVVAGSLELSYIVCFHVLEVL